MTPAVEAARSFLNLENREIKGGSAFFFFFFFFFFLCFVLPSWQKAGLTKTLALFSPPEKPDTAFHHFTNKRISRPQQNPVCDWLRNSQPAEFIATGEAQPIPCLPTGFSSFIFFSRVAGRMVIFAPTNGKVFDGEPLVFLTSDSVRPSVSTARSSKPLNSALREHRAGRRLGHPRCPSGPNENRSTTRNQYQSPPPQ